MKTLKPYQKTIDRSLDLDAAENHKQAIQLKNTLQQTDKTPIEEHVRSNKLLVALITSEMAKVFEPKTSHNKWFMYFCDHLVDAFVAENTERTELKKEIRKKIALHQQGGKQTKVEKKWSESFSNNIKRSKKVVVYCAYTTDQMMVVELQKRIERRKANLKKSLENNVIPFYLETDKVESSHTKSNYYIVLLKQLGQLKHKEEVESYLTEEVTRLAAAYGFSDFIKNVQSAIAHAKTIQIELNNEEREKNKKEGKKGNFREKQANIGSAIKSEWHKKLGTLPQKDKEPEKRESLLLFHNELKELLDTLFPVRKNEKAISNLRFLNANLVDQIKGRLIEKYKNKLTQHLIRIGKTHFYKDLMHADGEDATITVMQSKQAIKIGIAEDFVRDVIGTLAFANYGFRNLLSEVGNEQDILGRKCLEAIPFFKNNDVTQEETIRQLLALYFGDGSQFNDLTTDELKYLICAIRTGIQQPRNEVYHFKGVSQLNSLFCIPPSSIENIANVSEEVIDKVNTRIKATIKHDISLIEERIKAELEASFVLNYFTKEEVLEVLPKVAIFESPLSLKPSFKKIYIRATNTELNQSNAELNHNLVSEINKNEHADNRAYTAHRKMWQFYYEHCAWQLLENCFSKKEEFEKVVQQIIKKSQEKVDFLIENQSAETTYTVFESISVKECEKLEDYFFKLQSFLATKFPSIKEDEKSKQGEFVTRFIQDLVLHVMQTEWENNDNSILLLICGESQRQDNSEDLNDLAIPIECANLENETDLYPFYLMLHMTDGQQASNLLHTFNKLMAVENADKPNFKNAETLRRFLVLYNYIRAYKIGNPTQALNEAEIHKLLPFYNDEEALREVVRFNADKNAEELQNIVSHKALRQITKYSFLPLLQKVYSLTRLKASGNELKSFENIAIKELQQKRASLHEEWEKWIDEQKKKNAKEREKEWSKKEDYRLAVKNIDEYNHLKHKLHLHYVQKLHAITIDLLSKFIQSSAMWERDFQFFLYGLSYFGTPLTVGDVDEYCKEDLGAYRNEIKGKVHGVVAALFFKDNDEKWLGTRNFIAHLNYLSNNKNENSLIECINLMRDQMSYDRKLKNAVAAKFLGYLKREKIELTLKMDKNHEVYFDKTAARSNERGKGPKSPLVSSKIVHLGGKLPLYAHHRDFVEAVGILLQHKPKLD